MEQDILKKISKAEKLRKKPAFPFSIVVKPDYMESGELFCEAAKASTDLETKTRLYSEAARTFMMNPEEYNVFRASECYRKLFDMHQKGDAEVAVGYYVQYCECMERCEKWMQVGDAYTKMGDLLVERDGKKAKEMYRKAKEAYGRDPNFPVHQREAAKKCLMAELEVGDIEGAMETVGEVKEKHGGLCRHLLMFLAGKADTEEALVRDEEELVMALVNQERSAGVERLEAFKEKNVLSPVVLKVFEMVLDRLKPENDIC